MTIVVAILSWVVLAVIVAALIIRKAAVRGDAALAQIDEQDAVDRGWAPWRDEQPASPAHRRRPRPNWLGTQPSAHPIVTGWDSADDQRFAEDIGRYRAQQVLPGERVYR